LTRLAARYAGKPEPRQQGRKDDHRLLQREIRPDADARAITKGQIGKAVNRLGVGKAGRVKPVRVGPQIMVTVQRIDRQDNGITGAHLTAAQFILRHRRARQEGRGRIHPQGFVHDLADQRQGHHIGRRGCTVAQHSAGLGAGGLLNVLIERTQIQRP
jgi:hypothetical protein